MKQKTAAAGKLPLNFVICDLEKPIPEVSRVKLPGMNVPEGQWKNKRVCGSCHHRRFGPATATKNPTRQADGSAIAGLDDTQW